MGKKILIIALFLLFIFGWVTGAISVRERYGDTAILFEGDSIYNHITVKKEGSLYCMLFGRLRDSRETCIDLNDPDLSVFEYTAMMFVGFLFHPESKNICLIGLGGGYIPSLFSRYLPQVQLQIVEIDPLVVKLAKKYFNFTLSARQNLAIEDGRLYLRKNAKLFDQIWVDAFNSDYIPAHMTTREFLLLCKQRLTTHGILLQNVHGGNQLYDAQVETFRSVFAKVFVFEGERSANRIIVAADRPLYEPPDLWKQGLPFQGKIGKIDLRREAKKYNPKPSIKKAPILTDDYNPANLMLLRS